jgi:AcrR family transcriptional regulator
MADHRHANIAEQLEGSEELGPRSRPIQERAKHTVNRILESAAELVDEVGVVGFTTNLLAERADIRIRTIYRYFPSKLGILSALMLHLNEDSAERLKRFSELGDPTSDWRELVDAWIDDLVTWMRERPGARLLMGWTHGIPELMALQDRIDEEWKESMVEALRARGVDLPSRQLYAVCCTFNETLDALSEITVSDVDECSAEMIAEMRTILISYLEIYLD